MMLPLFVSCFNKITNFSSIRSLSFLFIEHALVCESFSNSWLCPQTDTYSFRALGLSNVDQNESVPLMLLNLQPVKQCYWKEHRTHMSAKLWISDTSPYLVWTLRIYLYQTYSSWDPRGRGWSILHRPFRRIWGWHRFGRVLHLHRRRWV